MTDKSTRAAGSETSAFNYRSLAIMLAVIVGLLAAAAMYPQQTRNIVLMLLGFGGVIFIHELGHFVAAKAVNIEVEAFSLGINPVILGIKRVAGGFQVRILPELIPGKGGLGAMSFTLPWRGARAGETEYRLGMIPLGGFVKMLGQEDIGPDKASDNPRAFGNRPVWQRAIVISAGVFMNVVSAAVVFILVFLHGVEMVPAVVGGVAPSSAAAKAGIQAGDVVLAVDGEENPTFVDLSLGGAFPGDDNLVELTVRHRDGQVETLQVEPEMNEKLGVRQLGIYRPETLTVAKLREPEAVEQLEKLGLRSGDEVVAVNGEAIEHAYELEKGMYPEAGEAASGAIRLTVRRGGKEGTEHTVEIPMEFWPDGRAEHPGQVLTMAPRLRVETVVEGMPAERAGIKKGDVLLRVGSAPNPTMSELIEAVSDRGGEPVELLVLREAEEIELTVTPKNVRPGWQFWKEGRFVIGTGQGFLVESPVVADTRSLGEGFEALPVPRGSRITSIAGEAVGDYADMIEVLAAHRGQEVEIAFQPPDTGQVQTLTTKVPEDREWIGFSWQPDLGRLPGIPLEILEAPVQAKSLAEALRLGLESTETFIAQTYLTIKGMFAGSVKPNAASGPVGIFQMSYTVASEKSLVFYCYFMAMISAMIAVFNFLPIPILDGGLFVLLMVEKIKGSPLSVRTQTVLNYIGLIMIGALFLYVTYNDIVRAAGLDG